MTQDAVRRTPYNFLGMTALVTGASYGIGEHFARELAREGAHLILTARSQDKLEALAADLRQTFHVKVLVVTADLSQPDAPRQLFDTIQKEKMTVDLLINNAGFGRAGKFESVSVEKDQAMLSVNIHSLVALTHLFLPGMLERKKGGVMNIASTAAFQPLPFLTLYAASKAFVLNFTEGLWKEYQNRGVRIFCLCPGNTITDFHNTAGIPPRRVFFSAEPRDVVRYGLKVFRDTNRPSAVYGFINNILAFGYRILPRRWMLEVVGDLYPQESAS